MDSNTNNTPGIYRGGEKLKQLYEGHGVYNRRKAVKVPHRDGDRLLKLYIEPTSLCNLNCAMCFRKTWIDESFGNLSFENFRKIIEDPMFLSDTETVFFGGMGEPLIHPDIFRMIEMVKAAGKRVELITNGTSIRRELCERLVSLGIDMLWVSIDSFDPDGYKKIQVGSDFGTVVNNIESYNKAREGSDCGLGLTFVLMKSNILQLLAFEDFSDYVKADRVNLSNMIPNTLEMESETLAYQTILHEYTHPHRYGGKKSDNVALIRFMDEDLEANPGVEKLLDEYGGLLWKGQPLLRRADNCRFIDEGTCFVRWDGDVSPCMGLLHSAKTCLYKDFRTVMHFSYGNIAQTPLSVIWRQEDYVRFRKDVDEYDYAPCVSCGGCLKRLGNTEDCIGNYEPTCGACLWGQGVAQCP